MTSPIRPSQQLLYFEKMLAWQCKSLRHEADFLWTAATCLELLSCATGFYGIAKAKSIVTTIAIAAPSLWLALESDKMRKVFSFVSSTALKKEKNIESLSCGEFSNALEPQITSSFFLRKYFKIDCPKS